MSMEDMSIRELVEEIEQLGAEIEYRKQVLDKYSKRLKDLEEYEKLNDEDSWESLKEGQKYFVIHPDYSNKGSVRWNINTDVSKLQFESGIAASSEEKLVDLIRIRKLEYKAKTSKGNREYVDGKHNYTFDYYEGEFEWDVWQDCDIDPKFRYWDSSRQVEDFIEDNKEELEWYFTEYKNKGK